MIILGTNSVKAAGGFDVANSLRFNDGSQDSLSRTPGSASNRRTWTWSGWIKRSALGIYQIIFSGGSANTWIRFNDTDKLEFNIQDNDESTIITTQLFRDVSAWYHIVVAIDTTQGTNTNRIKFYVNGNQVTSFSTSVYVSQNYQAGINNTGSHYIGRLNYAATQWFDGYMAEVVLIDGQQLDPTSFGEFDEDSGIWKPIDVSGLTFGTNGFHLDFEDSAALGDDVSGNSNDFTVNNLTAIDQTTDTPTLNYATLNPLDNYYFDGTFSEGNLKVAQPSGTECYITSTIGVATGKWYWEIKITSSGSNRDFVGIADKVANASNFSPYSGNSKMLSYYGYTGESKAGGTTITAYGSTFTTGDIIGVAMDLDNNKLYFSKNGTFQDSGNPTSGATGTGAIDIDASPLDGVWYAQFANIHNTASTFEANFGNPSYTISSGNADGNSKGNFEYLPPEGYFALCTANLAEFG